jgi:hypothetical protein
MSGRSRAVGAAEVDLVSGSSSRWGGSGFGGAAGGRSGWGRGWRCGGLLRGAGARGGGESRPNFLGYRARRRSA